MRILVTGASGFVGSLLIPRLLADGHDVRALGREEQRVSAALEREAPPHGAGEVQILRGDAVSGEGLKRALAGVELAYYLIHSMERSSASPASPVAGASFAQRDHVAAENFAAAARAAKVSRLIYLGGLLPGAGEQPRPARGAAVSAASRHLESRADVERILLEAIPGSLALRSSIVIGARSRSFRLLVRLVERMPVLTLPSWRTNRTQPIDARDIIEMLAVSATQAEVGGFVDVGGPEVLSYEEILTRLAELMLVNRPSLGVGVSATPFTARLAAAITGEDPELVSALMESLDGDLLAGGEDAAQLLGVELHSFDSAVEHALSDWERFQALAAR